MSLSGHKLPLLYANGLPSTINKNDLLYVFLGYGVQIMWMLPIIRAGVTSMTACIQFRTVEQADIAMSRMNWRAIPNVPNALLSLSREPVLNLFPISGPQEKEGFTFNLEGVNGVAGTALGSGTSRTDFNHNDTRKGKPYTHSTGVNMNNDTQYSRTSVAEKTMQQENAELRAKLQQLESQHKDEMESKEHELKSALGDKKKIELIMHEEQLQHRREIHVMKSQLQRDSTLLKDLYACCVDRDRWKTEYSRLVLVEDKLKESLKQLESECANLRKDRDDWHFRFSESEQSRIHAEEERDRLLLDEAERQRIINEARDQQKKRQEGSAHSSCSWEDMEARIKEEDDKRKEEQLAADIKRELRRQDRMPWKKATFAELKRCRERDIRDWGEYPWTPKLALDRFHAVSHEFLTTVYSQKKPVTVASIPWPVLLSPHDITLEKITWENVEQFLRYAKSAYGSDNVGYMRLVKQIQLMFHPDKWQSRNLFSTIIKVELRKLLQSAGNVVSQAVNQWKA